MGRHHHRRTVDQSRRMASKGSTKRQKVDVVVLTTEKVRKVAWFEKLMDGAARASYEDDEEKHLHRIVLQGGSK